MILMLVENNSPEEGITTMTLYRPDFYFEILSKRKISNERIVGWIPADEFDILTIRFVLWLGWHVVYNEESFFI